MTMRSPAFQFYPRQFAGDHAVMAMDLDVVGAHILLMCVAAASPEYRIPAGNPPDGCRMPSGEKAIRNRLRKPPEAAESDINAWLQGRPKQERRVQ